MTVIAADTTRATPTTAPARSAISSDFDTFLRMMTVQMKNQDPMNPTDSADYAMQLATFSGVEQQIKTNQLLQGLSSQFGVLGLAQLAGWVGQEARSAAPVQFSGTPVAVSYTTADHADRAVLQVKDASGALVAEEQVPLDGSSYSWLGGDRQGNPLPNGLYSLSVQSYAADTTLGEAVSVQSYARIVEARGGAAGAALVLEGGVEVPASEVTALRVP